MEIKELKVFFAYVCIIFAFWAMTFAIYTTLMEVKEVGLKNITNDFWNGTENKN